MEWKLSETRYRGRSKIIWKNDLVEYLKKLNCKNWLVYNWMKETADHYKAGQNPPRVAVPKEEEEEIVVWNRRCIACLCSIEFGT